MNFSRNKIVRFKDGASERSSPERNYSSEDGLNHTRNRPTLNHVWSSIQRRLENASDRVKGFTKPIRPPPPSDQPATKSNFKKKILDPQDPYLQLWNKAFVVCCVIAVSVDPLFFYIPMIDPKRNCLDLDKRLEIVVCVLRTFFDIFYIVHIIFQFRTGFIAPSSRVFGRGELVEDTLVIAKRYLYSYFIIDILSVLPVPQVIVLLITHKLKGSVALVTKESLKYSVFIQYVPRIIRIHPLYKEVKRTSGIFSESAWARAAFNLIRYMLASHVVGAFWYLFSIERQDICWREAFKKQDLNYNSLYLLNGKDQTRVNSFLVKFCIPVELDDITNSEAFKFGIFFDSLRSGVVETRDFPKKFFYCFWWGLRNLSSLGQNLKTSTYVSEIVFAIFIAIFGLVLFSLLIGNMQTVQVEPNELNWLTDEKGHLIVKIGKYLQSTTKRVEEMRVKRQDAEQWMSHRMLPETLRERIRRYEQYKWQETRGVEEDRLIRSLPKDLRRDIKRHLCLALLMRVPLFKKMDDQLLDAMCDRLKPVLYSEKSFILREGDPVEEMLFIMRGNSVTMTTNGGRTGFFNSHNLKAGDFCGEGLLTWALDPNTSPNLPISARTVQALTEVEAFGLMSEDLKYVANQFRRLHSRQFRHTFKSYSVQWKTWAACFIQAAWRHHRKRKLEKSLCEEEDRLQKALAKETETSPSLGATLYAARFAANALIALRRNGPLDARFPPQILLPLLPPKPAEPDFTTNDLF